ncbi:MAG: xanthine dehydrogenase family protein molybdopterin-binding subunit [Rhodobacteraceae bacterium]|nr:xanthine dehydrogenase family protein molybdopterin-binding subunit [Paracoccaceae bacterium]
MTVHTSRRGFIQGAAALGAALVVGLDTRGALAASAEATALNPFVTIGADGGVTVMIKHFEMGQGATTGLTTLVAEELDADWDQVTPAFAPSDNETYKNLAFGGQGTGGSTAIANSYMQYRQAAAAARELLVQAAAAEWGVEPSAISIENGELVSGATRGNFGQFIEAAAQLTPSEQPALKSPDAFRYIGRDKLTRKDTAAKIDGSATFAIDVKVPGMVYAVILRAPRFGGQVTGFDASDAMEVTGFLDAKALPNKAGVAVYAKSTWAALQAREAITAEWDFSAAENRGTEELVTYHRELLDAPTYQAHKGGDFDAVAQAVDAAATKVEAEFLFPMLAHAPMEPLNCVIEPTEGGGVRLHDGCQFPGITHPALAQMLGLEMSQVEINTVYAGGSFGRRATVTADYQAEAAMAFDLLGRETPVKLVWSREDDIRGGYYRPMAAHRARIGLDAEGAVAGWDHHIAVKPIIKGTPFEAALVHDGVDHTSIEGVGDSPYTIPNMSVGLTDADTPVPVLWWRAVGHTHTAFVMESLMDMAAHAAGADPVDWRLRHLSGDSGDHKRLTGVLKLAATKSGWAEPASEGRARGVAVHKSFGSYVAQVAEISVDADGLVKVEKVTCAVDCGVVVNPDVVRAQMEGGIGYGLGHFMRNQITLTEGEVDQSNFPDYEPLRLTDMPEIEVHMVASGTAPTGVGEPGAPPVGPALANAIFAATGERVTSLPLAEHGVSFA